VTGRPALPPLSPLPHREHLDRVRALADLSLADLGPDDALLVTDLLNVRYLTGFTGSAGLLLLRATDAVLITDERYGEQAVAQSGAHVEVVTAASPSQLAVLGRAARGLRSVGFDPEQVSVGLHERVLAAVAPARLEPRPGLPEQARRIKGPAEIERIRRAAGVAVAAHARALESLADEPTEEELAHRFTEAVRELGGDGLAFATIVASGPRTSMPHATPSDRRVRPGDVLLMDFGAAVDGYLSDVSRTVAIGDAGAEIEELIAVVTAAHDAGIALARPGVTHAAIDAECRRVLADHGYVDGPTHPFGHQLGLWIHERPFLHATATEPLEAGNIITVEPGVYFPGRYGCRVEDTVRVTPDGADVLSRAG
jgi:Xaa-Pro aminopeptidase